MTQYARGKRSPRHDARTLQLEHYLTAPVGSRVGLDEETPAQIIPTQQYWQNSQSGFYPMAGNDNWGDCVEAAACHQVQNWEYNNGSTITPTDAEVLAAYSQQTGFNGTASTDNGTDMLASMNWWRKTGYQLSGKRHTIAGYAAFNANTATSVLKRAIYEFGSINIGVLLPQGGTADTQFNNGQPWTVTNAPDNNDGHCIPSMGYDDTYLYVVTWGAVQKMTWGFFQKYCDEGYVALSSQDWDNKLNSPSGFNLAALQSDIAAF